MAYSWVGEVDAVVAGDVYWDSGSWKESPLVSGFERGLREASLGGEDAGVGVLESR